MRGIDLTPEQKAVALDRCQRVNEIIADYEEQHGFKLQPPWKEALPRLLLGGLSDPELHLIF